MRLQEGEGRELLERAFETLGTRGEMELRLAFVDDRAVAFQIDFVMSDRIWHYQCAYDERFRHTRAGSILTYEALREAWERGVREFDYLSGEEPYKLERTNASRTIHHLAAHRRSARGWLAYGLLVAPQWQLRNVPAVRMAYKAAQALKRRLCRGRMAERPPAGAEAAAVRPDISAAMRDRYVAYRRRRRSLARGSRSGATRDSSIELQLRAREGSALDELVKLPAASVADLAVKLEVLRELSSGQSPIATQRAVRASRGGFAAAHESLESEGRMLAVRLTLTLLLNAAAVDRESLERTRQAALDLLDRPGSPCSADARLAEAARDEVGALFTWID